MSASNLNAAILLALTVALGGCRAQQLGADQKDMRGVLLSLYDEQVMDNLVRIKEGDPFVQVDYSNMTGTIQQTGGIATGGSYQKVTNGFGATPGQALPAASAYPLDEALTRGATFSLSGQQASQLTMTAQPAITADAIYTEYLKRASDNKFIIGPVTRAQLPKRKPGATTQPYHRAREGRNGWYYIPSDQASEYLTVFMRTTLLRQQSQPVLVYTDTTALGLTMISEPDAQRNRTAVLTLKDKVRNDNGQLIAYLNGVGRPFTYLPSSEVGIGQPTDQVIVRFPNGTDPTAVAGQIANKPVRLYNTNFAEGPRPQPQDSTEALRKEFELLRLQQFNNLLR